MSLVFKNALMPSENQQVLRLRLAYLMRRLLVAPLIFTLLSPINALAEGKPSQCLGSNKQSCIDFMIANGTCAIIKFQNDGKEGKEPYSLALRFFANLTRAWDTDPFQKKITTDDDEINKRRFDFVESVCPIELDKIAARKFKDKANQEMKRPFSIATIRRQTKFITLKAFETTLDVIRIDIDSKKTTTN